MASEIRENDWMFSGNGMRPWHGIGTVVTGCPTSDEAIKLAKLDWDVVQYPVSANGKEIPDHFANVRSDTNEALGIVKSRYTVVQNLEAFDFVDSIIGSDEVECHYETAGSLFNGRRIFLCVRLPQSVLVGDKVDNYLFFTNSHDGTSSLLAGITNVRVVCNNTLQMAIQGAQRTWKVRHTMSIKDKTEEAKLSLGLAVKYMDSMKVKAEQMAWKKVREEEFFKALFDSSKMAEQNKEQMITSIHNLYHNKADLANFKGTAWGLYNAVADHVSNSDPIRMTRGYKERKLADFFDGYKLLETAQKILVA